VRDGGLEALRDFHQGFDKIEFSQVTGVHQFSDLQIAADGSGNTVITTPHDTVTVVNFTGAFTAHDFIII